MKPSSETISTIFFEPIIYTIPVFQRTFEWDEELWEGYYTTLWRKYESGDIDHLEFMGTLVVKKILSDQNQKYWVIDGQQRLTTTFLALAALKSVFNEDKDLSQKISNILFINRSDSNCGFLPKLELSESDNSEFSTILNGFTNYSIKRIYRCFGFFLNKFKQDEPKIDSQKMLDSITKGLQFIFVKLDRVDNAGYVFETINQAGIHLEPIDTIRNNILGKFDDIEKMNYLYKNFWKEIEREFNRIGEFPIFLRYFLLKDPNLLKTGFFKQEQLTSAIMGRLSIELKADSQFEDIQTFLDEMKRYARYYTRILDPNLLPKSDEQIKIPLLRIRFLLGTQYMPFLLKCMGYYNEDKLISSDTFIEILKCIETFYVRKSVCGLTFRNDEILFFNLCSLLSRQSVTSILHILNTELFKVLPSDGTFEKNFVKNDLYRSSEFNKFTQFLLLSIEEEKGGMGVSYNPDPRYTIEHIMPQTLTEEWESHLGQGLKDHGYYLHTIGNLTLVTSKVNRRIYNHHYRFKFEELEKTGYCINNELSEKKQWKISDIEKRAYEFVKMALNLWPAASSVEFRPLEKNVKLHSVTIKGECFEVCKIAPLIEVTITGILKDKQWSSDHFVKIDKYNELSSIETAFKSYQKVDCGEYGVIYCKKYGTIETAYKFCRNLIESAGWQPNEDWYGMASFKEGKYVKYRFA